MQHLKASYSLQDAKDWWIKQPWQRIVRKKLSTIHKSHVVSVTKAMAFGIKKLKSYGLRDKSYGFRDKSYGFRDKWPSMKNRALEKR